MDGDLLQGIADIVFSGYMLYLAPFLLLMMGSLFADRLIDLLMSSLQTGRYRRSGY